MTSDERMRRDKEREQGERKKDIQTDRQRLVVYELGEQKP